MDWSLGNIVAMGLRVISNRAEVERVGKKLIAQIVQAEELWNDVRSLLEKIAPQLLVDVRAMPAAALSESEQRAAPTYDMRWVQQALNHLLHPRVNLKVDGDMGPLTKEAIKLYQGQRGLTVDGWLGPQTMAALDADIRRAQP